MTIKTHFDRTRLTTKPVTTAEIEKSRKKLDPTRPNCFGVKLSSVMIGTPANPMMALSAKLIIMKKNSRATIVQAPFSGRTSVMAFFPRCCVLDQRFLRLDFVGLAKGRVVARGSIIELVF